MSTAAAAALAVMSPVDGNADTIHEYYRYILQVTHFARCAQ
jgi:hypothetical protein